MKKLRKLSLLTVIMLTLLLTTSVFALDDILSYTSESAEDVAIEGSKQLLIDELDIQVKESNLEEAKEEATKNDYPGGSRVDRLKRSIIVKVDPLVAEANLEVAKKQKEDNTRVLKKNIYIGLMDILLAEKELEMEQEKLIIIQAKYQIAKDKYDKELTTEYDVFDYEYQVDNKQIDILNVQDKLQLAKYEFNRLLNQDLDQVVEIEGSLTLEESSELDLIMIEDILNNDTAVYEKTQDLIAKEITFDLTAIDYKDYTKEYKEANYEQEIARLDFDDTKVNLEVNIRNQFNVLLNKMDQYELAVKYLEIITNKLRADELKFENGMIAKVELLSQKEAYLDAEYQMYVAIYDFNTAKLDFDNMIKQ